MNKVYTNFKTKMSRYTHNLKILIVDENDEVINDNECLIKIKEKLQNSYTHKIDTQSVIKIPSITLHWDLHSLSKIQSYFMGDLFACPTFDYDTILYSHTEKTLKIIENELGMKHKIKFHISRMPYNKSLLPQGMMMV